MQALLSSRVDFLEDPLDVDRVLLVLAEAHLPRPRDVDMVGCHTANASKEGRRGCQSKQQQQHKHAFDRQGATRIRRSGFQILLTMSDSTDFPAIVIRGGFRQPRARPPKQFGGEQARRCRASVWHGTSQSRPSTIYFDHLLTV